MEKELLNLLAENEYGELAKKLNSISAEEVEKFFSTLTDEQLKETVRGFDSEDTAQFLLTATSDELKERIIEALRNDELKEVIDELSTDEAVELIEDVPVEVALRFAEEEEILRLLEQRNFKVLKPLLSQFNPTDLAEIFNEVPRNEIGVIFRLLPKDLASETFVDMDSDMKQALLEVLNDKELKAVTNELYLDDTVDLIEEMPANVVRRIIALSDTETRGYINELLKYPRDSAGSIMTIEYVSLKANMTVEGAFERIRKTGVDKETIYTLYVTDEKRKLIGIVSAKDLMLASPTAQIGEIMEENVIYATTHEDKETVARMIAKYGFLALPIVDTEERLVGIVTVDDAMEILQEENTEDMAKTNAIISSDKPYLKTSVLRLWLNRVPWLLILMISATFTGMVISANEQTLNMPVYGIILTACIPMLMGTGGNAGSQASVTIIRSLAIGELRFRDIGRVLWKELRVSIILGVTLSIACFIKLITIDGLLKYDNGLLVSATICLSMLVTIVLAKLIGCVLPLLAKKCKLDPAVVASPFITTIIDTLSLTVYCAIAIALLGTL